MVQESHTTLLDCTVNHSVRHFLALLFTHHTSLCPKSRTPILRITPRYYPRDSFTPTDNLPCSMCKMDPSVVKGLRSRWQASDSFRPAERPSVLH